jgi:Phosphotransferase enzyme family
VPAPWTDLDWLEGAHAWIAAQLDRLGLEPDGPAEQPHVRPWATALRVPTSGGTVWFKAMIPVLAHEAAVVDVISRRRPDLVPELLAADLDLGWMLMSDGGSRLRELVERERSLDRWLDALPRYGELQLALAGDADHLAALGVPDRRLAGLAAQYGQLVERLPEFRGTERRVADLCARLCAFGLPESIQHDDLHDAQVFVRDGQYLFFDWGDSCISHPFFSMSVTLEGNVSWGLDDDEGSVDIEPFRDAYLEAFTGLAPVEELRAAQAVALRLGWICRALNVDRYASALDSPDREQLLEGVPLRLRLALR